MQLNIYLMSHPVIQILANDIIYKQDSTIYNDKRNNHSQLGFLIIYEILRKSLIINKIYIKKLHYIREIHTLNKSKPYLILTNIIKSYSFINNALDLFPEVKVQHITTNQDNNTLYNQNKYQLTNNTNIEVFIIELHLNNYSIIDTLDQLILRNEINSKSIKIICITCINKILDKIGAKYPNLSIYTTKIINH